MLLSEKKLLRTGEISPTTGYYLYTKSAESGVVPCIPTNEEEVIILNKGDVAPPIVSCGNHAALYKLVAKKS